jgi:gas vesicle protein
MKNFVKGMLVGIGIGLLVAPMKGEELRRELSGRISEWRRSLPEDSRLNQYANQVSDQVAYTKEHWRDYAQQAVSVAKDKGSTLGNKAMHASQDMVDRAKQSGIADKAKKRGQELAGKVKHTDVNEELTDQRRHIDVGSQD